jgi:hypothetical protein
MSFLDFPANFPAITNAINNLLAEALGPPPDMRSLGQKTAEAFSDESMNLDLIKKRDWRNVPYAIWLPENAGLKANPAALQRYFEKELPTSLENERRPIKWARPLVFVYIENFEPSDPIFKKLANCSSKFFQSPKVTNAVSLVGLARNLRLFDLQDGPRNTAESISNSRRPLQDWIKNNDLWPSFGVSPFALAAFNSYLSSSDDVRRSDDFIATVLEWSVNDQQTLRYPSSRVNIAEALLLPWKGVLLFDENKKNTILNFLIHHYGDPRIGKNLWHGVSEDALKVLIAWINGRTLEAFFKILRETADSIWQHRQKFWTAYFKQGHIEEVWVALGPDAASVLRRLDESKQLKYANLLGSESSQSVLLIRIGQLLFCEWSHNGRLRAERIDAALAPKMYQSYYESEDLRFQSLDFNNNQLQDPGLVHFSSEAGGWQERARMFILKQTGIRMTQAEVTR